VNASLDLATDYAQRLFTLGDVAAMRFFGGAALRLDGVQFGMVMKGVLYFRVDDTSRNAFLAAGSGPFVYRGSARDVRVATWLSVPADILEQPEELRRWAAAAHRAAMTAAAMKKKRR
jgi:DNA transformation protein